MLGALDGIGEGPNGPLTSNMLKVLHVLNELQPSGAETMLRLAARPWQARGVQLDVLSLGVSVGAYAPHLRQSGIRIHHQPLQPVRSFVPSFIRLLRDEDYDIVHVHHERANALTAAIAKSGHRTGVVRTVHNVFAFDGRLRLERRVQRALLRSLGVKHIAVGESVQANELQRFGNPTLLIRNTFDEARFVPPSDLQREYARQRLNIDPSEFVVLVVGNCSDVKNHAALLHALAEPSAPEARLLHVGLEEGDRIGERQLVDRLGLGSRVEFLGFVDNVPEVLQASDCYVMPSQYEGLAVTALEMLGGGIPSVLADVPGLRDLRRHVPHAWWVEPEPKSIAAALGAVARLSEDDRRVWSTRTAAAIREHFGMDRYVDSHLEAYRNLLAG
jgi:glycosyltransferase involved in cell wall biosynthesis